MNSSTNNNLLSNKDNLLLRAWHNGELSVDDEEALEKRLFFEPALAKAAAIDQDIRAGIVAPKSGTAEAGRQLRKPVERIWPLMAAASLGAIAVLLPTAFRDTQESSPLLGNVEWVRLDHVRSANASTTLISPDGSAGALVLEVPAPSGSGPFTASIISDDGAAPELHFEYLSPVDGALTLVVPRQRLRAGDYRLTVQASGNDGEPSSLAFRYQP